ncbi:hypothetical protein V6N13_047690 [Hibiscus sabdariffa]|uniref:Uncharacterized protein n=1 Tax=Hibiscus sabdariffa TaxID=183260 RepID=A0ABR2F507_9ROSI
MPPLSPSPTTHPLVVVVEVVGNETGTGGGGNAITDETNVALYADLVEEVKGLTDELNGWVAGEGNADE